MKSIGFIFARGGSKGLPGKNTLPFNGKPLIAWAIERALAVERIERLIVSTDSEEIAQIAKKFGAEVPFIRPSELSQDGSPEWLAWRHGLEYIKSTSNQMPDYMVSIPVTAPLGLASDIEKCIDEYQKGGMDIVITITDPHRSPFFNMVKKNSDETYGLVNPPPGLVNRRQDAQSVYDMATVCYVANSDFVMKSNSMFEGRVGAVHVPVERAIDIDTALDFRIAEFIMKSKGENQ
jgi:N-acylneuraminate cytidylyltransferase